jgi:hypothetical protein
MGNGHNRPSPDPVASTPQETKGTRHCKVWAAEDAIMKTVPQNLGVAQTCSPRTRDSDSRPVFSGLGLGLELEG